MRPCAVRALAITAITLGLLSPSTAGAQSVRIGPEYPPNSPSGWTCLAINPFTDAVFVYSATVDPAPACQTLQEVINQQLQQQTGGFGLKYALEIEQSSRQQYANDPACPPTCLPAITGGQKYAPACDLMVGAIEYVVLSGNGQDDLCGFLHPVAQAPSQTEQGVTITNGNTGQQTKLLPGTFVQIGDAPAIYVVRSGQLHAFSTWQQFVNAGGMADLSNVVRYASLNDRGGLIGAPIQ